LLCPSAALLPPPPPAALPLSRTFITVAAIEAIKPEIKEEELELPDFGDESYIPEGFDQYEWNDLTGVFITFFYHALG
jgi:hypothetical protein